MEIKGWQKLSIGANLNVLKEYILAVSISVFAIIVISAINIIDNFIIHPNYNYLSWLNVIFAAMIVSYVHYKILKLIRTTQTILFAYETYQKKVDEILEREKTSNVD